MLELECRTVPTYLGQQLFPLDNPWNQDISGAPVASNSGDIIARINNRHINPNTGLVDSPNLHVDFGDPIDDGELYGIPINIATSSTPKYDIFISPSHGYPDQSDPIQVPIPDGAVIEGDGPTGPAPSTSRGDSHLIVYDRDANVLYELYQAIRPNETQFPYGGTKSTGGWGAYNIAFWDLNTNDFRTIGDTSADAAGLPIMTGLLRPQDLTPPQGGGIPVIDHAIRMTVQQTRNSFVFPASHRAGAGNDSDLPRMGERFRLKADFVVPANWSNEAKAVAQAMKTYGMIVADNGSDMYFQGDATTLWTNIDAVRQIQGIDANAFEVVDLTPIVTSLSVNSGSTAGGTSVTITGKNFSGAAGRLHVLFGGVEATSFTINSDTQITALAPAQAAGQVDVRVQSGAVETDNNNDAVFFGYGTSANTPADNFTYTGASPPPPPPLPTVSVGNVQRNEGNANNTATFTVTLSSASATPVVVQYTTQNGTALSGVDYTATSGTITFAANQTSRTVAVTVRGDATVEPNETFRLVLSNPTGATLGTATGTATLLNDDAPSSPPAPPAPPSSRPPSGGSRPASRPSPAPLSALSIGPGFVFVTDQSGGIVFAGMPLGMYAGGVQAATGDVNADGVTDLVLLGGPGPLSGLVVVFNGRDFSPMSAFFALPGFPIPLTLAVRDQNADGFADFFLGLAGFGVSAVFSGRDNALLGVV